MDRCSSFATPSWGATVPQGLSPEAKKLGFEPVERRKSICRASNFVKNGWVGFGEDDPFSYSDGAGWSPDSSETSDFWRPPCWWKYTRIRRAPTSDSQLQGVISEGEGFGLQGSATDCSICSLVIGWWCLLLDPGMHQPRFIAHNKVDESAADSLRSWD